MSTPEEKYKAISRAGFFLESILFNSKRSKKDRESAGMILRHFPGPGGLELIFSGNEKLGYGLYDVMIEERDTYWRKK